MICFRNYIWLRHVCIVAEPRLCGMNIPLYNYMEEVGYSIERAQSSLFVMTNTAIVHLLLTFQRHYYYPLAQQGKYTGVDL